MNHNPLRGRPRLPSISTELAISILVVCFYVVFSLITPNFSSEYNLINLLKQASVKGIVTIAVTFVFIAGQCDLTVGASTALSAMICALLMSDHGWSPWSAIAVSVLCTLLVGVINGFIVMPNHLPVLSAEKETSSDPLHLIAVSAYPAGCQPLSSKITEIQEAISMGADEIFLVPMNGLILDNQWEKVEAELRGCKEAAGQIPITLIMELQVFDAEHAKKLCSLAISCGYYGLATSAGFAHNSIFSVTDPLALASLVCSTEPEQVRDVRNWIGDSINLVAVDATMSKEKAKQLLTAGADRIAAPTVLGWL